MGESVRTAGEIARDELARLDLLYFRDAAQTERRLL